MADTRIPPRWTAAELEEDRTRAVELFRTSRLVEPLEDYLTAFDHYRENVEVLLKSTGNLSRITSQAVEVLTNPGLLDAFRHLAGPPISKDDLATLAEATLSPQRLQEDSELAQRVVQLVLLGLDRRRFPWVIEGRGPSETEKEAAVLASAALLAANRAATQRRGEGKRLQEEAVRQFLLQSGLAEAPRRTIRTMSDAPAPGAFCAESLVGRRKADFVVTLWDQRLMPIECKVSNSATNSVKRLNNDAAVKAVEWTRDFGELQIVPVAVLSGVYKLRNLEAAQSRGLMLFWAHRLDLLGEWIGSTG